MTSDGSDGCGRYGPPFAARRHGPRIGVAHWAQLRKRVTQGLSASLATAVARLGPRGCSECSAACDGYHASGSEGQCASVSGTTRGRHTPHRERNTSHVSVGYWHVQQCEWYSVHSSWRGSAACLGQPFAEHLHHSSQANFESWLCPDTRITQSPTTAGCGCAAPQVEPERCRLEHHCFASQCAHSSEGWKRNAREKLSVCLGGIARKSIGKGWSQVTSSG